MFDRENSFMVRWMVFQTVWCYSGWQEPKDRTPIPYTVIVQARYGCNLANNIDKNLFSIWMLSWSESWRDSPGHYDAWESTHTLLLSSGKKSNRRELLPEKRTVSSVVQYYPISDATVYGRWYLICSDLKCFKHSIVLYWVLYMRRMRVLVWSMGDYWAHFSLHGEDSENSLLCAHNHKKIKTFLAT